MSPVPTWLGVLLLLDRESRTDLCSCGCERWEHYRMPNGRSGHCGAMTCGVSPRCRWFTLAATYGGTFRQQGNADTSSASGGSAR